MAIDGRLSWADSVIDVGDFTPMGQLHDQSLLSSHGTTLVEPPLPRPSTPGIPKAIQTRLETSKYHQKCCGYEPIIVHPVDKKFRESVNEMKRMILKLKMQNTPIELTYSHSRSLKALKKSKIPVVSKSGEEKSESEPPPKSHQPKAFIMDLVPHIQGLTPPKHPDASCAYREKFNAEYEEAYLRLAQSIKRRK